jgi:hypothetical protein
MKENTGKWLEPMLDAAREHDIDTTSLMARATMPAVEADQTPMMQFIQRAVPDGRHSVIDWIRFGELLREELGWANYPKRPEPEF